MARVAVWRRDVAADGPSLVLRVSAFVLLQVAVVEVALPLLHRECVGAEKVLEDDIQKT